MNLFATLPHEIAIKIFKHVLEGSYGRTFAIRPVPLAYVGGILTRLPKDSQDCAGCENPWVHTYHEPAPVFNDFGGGVMAMTPIDRNALPVDKLFDPPFTISDAIQKLYPKATIPDAVVAQIIYEIDAVGHGDGVPGTVMHQEQSLRIPVHGEEPDAEFTDSSDGSEVSDAEDDDAASVASNSSPSGYSDGNETIDVKTFKDLPNFEGYGLRHDDDKFFLAKAHSNSFGTVKRNCETLSANLSSTTNASLAAARLCRVNRAFLEIGRKAVADYYQSIQKQLDDLRFSRLHAFGESSMRTKLHWTSDNFWISGGLLPPRDRFLQHGTCDEDFPGGWELRKRSQDTVLRETTINILQRLMFDLQHLAL